MIFDRGAAQGCVHELQSDRSIFGASKFNLKVVVVVPERRT